MNREIAFEMAASSVRFGVGVTREVGMDLADLGVRRALVVTDPSAGAAAAGAARCSSRSTTAGVEAVLYDRVRVEPTDESFLDAIAFAEAQPFDAIVAVGGGSMIDTAKAVNLYTTYPPADFLDYVNPPIGKGLPVPGPLKPLIAIPDDRRHRQRDDRRQHLRSDEQLHAKTGIASRRLKPTLGYARSRQHADDAAAGGGVERARHPQPRDRVVHGDAVHGAAAPERPALRPAYQGSNPISDIWSLQALRMVSQFLVRAVDDPSDDEARANRCCWRRRTRASASAMPACTCRTACRIRCRAT